MYSQYLAENSLVHSCCSDSPNEITLLCPATALAKVFRSVIRQKKMTRETITFTIYSANGAAACRLSRPLGPAAKLLLQQHKALLQQLMLGIPLLQASL